MPKNDLEHEQMKNVPYASKYAQVYTRPDIALTIGVLEKYQSNLSVDH